MIVSAKARLAGVLGWPVGHSLSPRLHGYWLEQYQVDGAYLPLAVRPEAFRSVLDALVELGFRGANVTVPHKEAALEACHDLDAQARRIGAVNTIVIEQGRLLGSNSDAFGFMANLRERAPDWTPGGKAVVLGAGGAARAVVVALQDAGLAEICLVNRTRTRAEALAAALSGAGSGSELSLADWGDREAALEGAALLVNTTSLGMTGQPALVIDLEALPPQALVTDLVYRPLETELLAAARRRGNPAVDGLGMLLHQARPGFEAWFGVQPSVTPALRRFLLEAG